MTKSRRVSITNESLESRDGKSVLRLVWNLHGRKHPPKTKSRIKGATSENRDTGPALVVGFPGAGLVGSISANYLIEKMHLRQIAFIDSDYVVPTVIYTGGRLRHPFRIYSNKTATLFVMVCEAPVVSLGINSIMDLVANWSMINNIREVIVMDGIPIRELPKDDRKPEVLRSYPAHMIHDNVEPTNYQNIVDGKEQQLAERKNAVITGLSAGVLEACISFDIPCTGVLIPATSGVPDPEAAAILLEFVSAMPNVPIKVDVTPLRKEGDKIKKQLSAFIEELQAQAGGAPTQSQHPPSRYLGESTIYG